MIGLPGVKSVDNQLALRGDGQDSYSEAWLITKVKATLLYHRSINDTATEVSAADGVVSLCVKATSTEKKDLTTEYAMDVDGFKRVLNEMAVKTAQEIQDKQIKGDKLIGEKTMGRRWML